MLNRMPVPPPGRVAIALDPMLPVIVTGPPGVSIVEPSAGIPPDGGAIVVAYDGAAAWAVPAPTAIIVAMVAAISTFVIAIFHCFGIPGVICLVPIQGSRPARWVGAAMRPILSPHDAMHQTHGGFRPKPGVVATV